MSIKAKGLPYEMRASTVSNGYVIRRRDDDHLRTVAFVESMAQWERFVAAIRAGADEVAAVHAIDSDAS
jgi:hypothetical protein